MKSHSTEKCPNKDWLNKESTICLLCLKGHHARNSACSMKVNELTEFLLPALQNNQKLRHRARKKFGYVDPGKINNMTGKVGNVKAFHSFLSTVDTNSATSMFVTLLEFAMKEMLWEK